MPMELSTLLLKGLADADGTVDPYVRILREDGAFVAVTSTKKKVREQIWKNVRQIVRLEYGEPLFFEVWDYNVGAYPDSLLGVVAVFPEEGKDVYENTIRWDVTDRRSLTRAGICKVKLTPLR